MRVKKISHPECKKCKRHSLRKEPAGMACMICGWFKHIKNVSKDNLWRQHILNKQYFSPTLLIQLLGIYKANQTGSSIPLSDEELKTFEASDRISFENILLNSGAHKRIFQDEIQ